MSLPTPPSGILDKDRPWWRGRISDAQWDRLKAKLTGGTDAGGTSYSKFIDCSAAEADKIISNLKKDPRGYPQMHMPGGGESYQIMIDYFQWLKDSYLSNEPEEEEIPVEVEVVEVEQKQPDEPIKVIVEAPFEPTPTQPLSAPKRIKLPRRSGVIRPSKAKKKSAAERMAAAFDERLDDVLDSIKNPPAAAEPKERKHKETFVKIRRSLKPARFKEYKGTKGPGFFQNTSLFLFNKSKDALGRAAQLRREAAEQGMPAQERGFYAKKAFGLEFGGDAIARTRGTFSSSPDATLDPSLTKQQRYAAGIFGARTIRPPKEQDGVATDIDRQVGELEKKFNEVIDTKKVTPQSAQLEKTLEELRKKLQAGNKLQSDINASKKKLLSLEAKEADRAQARAEEAETDQTEDLSNFEDMDPGKKSGRGDGSGKDDEGGGLDIDWKKIKWKKWLRRLKNPGKFMRSLGRLGRMKFTKFLSGAKGFAAKGLSGAKALGAKAVAGAKGLVAGGAAATAAIVAGAGLAASGIGEGFFQLTKKGGTGEQVRDFFKKKGEETGGPMGSIYGAIGNVAGFSTEATKVTGNALDAIGAPFRYAIEGIRYPFLNEEDREKQAKNLAKFDARIREYSRGWMNQIDFMNIVPDEKGGFGNIYGNDEGQKEMMEKMSEGGTIPEPKFQGMGGARLTGDLPTAGPTVMAGEAGDEMVVTPESNPLQSLAPMIVAMREVTKRAGTWADPVENLVRQVTDPIAKKIGLPTLPTNVEIGQNIPDGKQGEQEDGKILGKKKGLLGGLIDFLKGGKGKKGKGGNSGAASIPYSGDVDMGGGSGRTTAGAVYNYLLSKGMSENHAKGITVNISRESGFKLGAHGDQGIGGSFGLFQWNMAAGRGGPMMAAVPDWKTNWKGQIDYALQEHRGPEYLRTQFNSAGDAAYWWMDKWEIPAAHIVAQYSPAVYEGMIQKMGLQRGMPVAPPAPPATTSPPPTPTSSGTTGTTSNNRRRSGQGSTGGVAARRAERAATPVTPAPAPVTASTGTVTLPLVFQQPAAAPQPAPNPLALPMTSTGELDWMEMARRERLGRS